LPHLIKSGGNIVSVSSAAAETPWPQTTPYNVAKAALNALIQSLAIANAKHGVRVNGVLPACIHTAHLDKVSLSCPESFAKLQEGNRATYPQTDMMLCEGKNAVY
jgi:NAD(P)-dependent dehydrogenase (short-subunit alcohol dehydrogenase family)